MIYLDASALVKLVVTEAESAALRRWLAEHSSQPRVSTALVMVELPRAVMRAHPTALLQAHQVVSRVQKVVLSPQVLATAASLQPPRLRSLDAVHLASALLLRPELEAFVCYDQRLAAAAQDADLPVAQPA